MKVAPRPLIGVAVLAAYLVVFYGIWALTGVDYPHIGDSAGTILKWYVAPLAGGAVVLVVAASRLGWWRPALAEVSHARPRWLLAGPIAMALIGLASMASKSYATTTASMVLLLVLGSLLVGFCEEMATRGLLIVGLRGRYREAAVWAVSTALFAFMHLPNWVFGAGPAAVLQVVLAFMGGTMFYVTRRVTGALVVAMLLHAFWDFSSFVGTDAPIWLVPLVYLNGLFALGLVTVLLRRERGQVIAQAGQRRVMPAAQGRP